MATIPLPALDVRPPAREPGPLEMYGQMMGIQSAQQEQQARAQQMQQQQAMAPIEQQSAQLQLQQQQQAQKDQGAFREAMQLPANQGKTIGDIADTLANSGGISMQGWQMMKKADVDQRTALATLDEKSLANAAAAHKQTQDLYNNVMNMPDDELAQSWPAIAQQYDSIPGNMKAPLNPQQPLNKQQLQQFGPMLAMHGAYLDEATARKQKQVELQNSQATLGKTQAEMQYYNQNGGAPGVPAETMELNDWLKQNPGKGASDYAIAMKKIVPAYNFNLSQGAAGGSAGATGGAPVNWGRVAQRYGMTSQAFDQTAEKYFQTGNLPPIGRSANAIAMNRDLMNRAAQLHPDGSLAANSAEYKANENSLSKLQTNYDQVQAFEQTASKNMDLLQRVAKNIPDLGTRFANVPVRMFTANTLGTENMAAFKTALNTAQTEAAKVLNSSNASGVLSDSARHELQEIIDGNMTYPAMVASLNTLRQDMGNRTQAYQAQIGDIQNRLKGTGAAGPGAGAGGAGTPAVGAVKTFPNGKTGKWDGSGWEAQ